MSDGPLAIEKRHRPVDELLQGDQRRHPERRTALGSRLSARNQLILTRQTSTGFLTILAGRKGRPAVRDSEPTPPPDWQSIRPHHGASLQKLFDLPFCDLVAGDRHLVASPAPSHSPRLASVNEVDRLIHR